MHYHHLLLLISSLIPTIQSTNTNNHAINNNNNENANLWINSNPYTFTPLKHSAGTTPYYTPHNPPLNPVPPQGCKISKASYIIRHSAIYPNDFEYSTYIEPFLEKLSNTSQNWNQSTYLSFLSNWTAPVNDSHLDKLTQIGLVEARNLGKSLAKRYSSLTQPGRIWSSTAERTVKSAEGFINGFMGLKSKSKHANITTTATASGNGNGNRNDSIHLVEVEESDDAGANSLTPYKGCSSFSSSYGNDQSSKFAKIYTKPIIARLEADVSDFNFTTEDITGMFELCGYETVIRGSSPFCSLSLFSADEWLGYEYASDIKYFHNTGYGRPLSGILGIPWVNASFAALEKSTTTPKSKSKSKNETQTQTQSETQQDLYISFTHREVPPMILTALGLYNNSAYTGSNNINATMPEDKINHNRVWRSSEILPFLTNIGIERMSCEKSFGFNDGDYYRVLVNDGPMPLVECRDGPGGSCSRGKFGDFIRERSDGFGGFNEGCGGDFEEELRIYE